LFAWRFEMKTQLTNGVPRRTALRGAGALAVALVVVAPAAAMPGFMSGADARALRAKPPVKYSVTSIPHHEKAKVVRGTAIPHLLPAGGMAVFPTVLVNTAGVASPVGVPGLVDDSSHIVNGKGYRVGGATP
jgi:hypothetical protein